MRRGELVHVELLAAGGGPAVEARAVPGGQAATQFTLDFLRLEFGSEAALRTLLRRDRGAGERQRDGQQSQDFFASPAFDAWRASDFTLS
jgi:hypothetical protein